MKIRLYLDEDSMDKHLVRALRSRNVDVTSALEQEAFELKDEDQLGFATQQGRVLYSFNVGDFCRIHADWLRRGKTHAGIVLAQQQTYTVGEQMRRLLRLIAEVPTDKMAGRLEFLSTWTAE